ncbi:MAG: phage major capsid protein [Faecalibacterium sp.]|nr:phage major capsid protein [Ruminococcus sp.]MCM1392099.1 phage major capsid protein [Ruminococcus sp.]MCM1485796.1 phage major capsid protein [Faecalibacterium sp.]
MTLKELIEKKNKIITSLEEINKRCEERVQNGESAELTDEEARAYDNAAKELQNISALIQRKTELREADIDSGNGDENDGEGGDESDEQEQETEEQEERAFRAYIMNQVNPEQRAEVGTNLVPSNSGVIIPKTIANKILDTLENICDVYNRATKYHFAGEVSFPVIDDSEDDVTVGYAEEFVELTSHVNGFKSVTLKGYLVGALALISKSLINNAQINVVNIIIMRMALAMKRFLEKECLHGTEGKMTGILSTENVVTAESATAITADDIISLQCAIINPLQANCVFYMHPKTIELVRKLKDSDGRYLLNNDITTGFKNQLLGKPVEPSDQMPQIGAGNKVIFYGDPSGLYVNIRENMSVEVLREKYHTMHAIGIDLWAEIDTKIVEKQKLAVLQCKG